MGTLFLDQIKKQASSFLQEKYKTARLTFTDITPAELLAEEATNNDPCSPDARTMTRIAEASFDIDEYWRIVNVLHRRLYSINWELWRQSYKSLVLIEFLLTHGLEGFAEEFKCHIDVIEELGAFNHIDEKGFNWGVSMQKKSNEILKLLRREDTLKEARLKALRITKEIQGFGSSPNSPSSSWTSSPYSSSSEASRYSSFGSYSPKSPTWTDHMNDLNKFQVPSPRKESMESYSQGGIRDDDQKRSSSAFSSTNKHFEEGSHLWEFPEQAQEIGSLLGSEDEQDHEKQIPDGFIGGICSKLAGISPSRGNYEVSGAERMMKKKLDRNYSLWY